MLEGKTWKTTTGAGAKNNGRELYTKDYLGI